MPTLTRDHLRLRAELEWCADHAHHDSGLKRATVARLRQLDQAARLHADVLDDNGTQLTELKLRQQNALQALLGNPTRDTLRTVSDLVATLDDTTQRQLRDVRAAERALNAARNTAARVFVDHVDDLVQLVAVERARDLTACGDDAVPDVVHDVWQRLDFAWHPTWDDALVLPGEFRRLPFTARRRHLPLTWAADNETQLLAALAWVWQALAAGDFERVAVPLTLADRQRGMLPGSRGTCLRITADPGLLPHVPPARQRTARR
jgi:hypothetical protein